MLLTEMTWIHEGSSIYGVLGSQGTTILIRLSCHELRLDISLNWVLPC